jgi:hypothetical protein
MMNDVSARCLAIDAETKRFLYEGGNPENSARLFEAGFQILMGPPHPDAPILFLGYQPGKGCKTALEEREYRSEDRWPQNCEYATEPWSLAKRLQDIFGTERLVGCVGLNAIFVRANSVKTYRETFAPVLRKKIEAFCAERTVEII